MAKQSVQYKPAGFNFGAFQFVNATGSAVSTIKSAGTNDSVVKALVVTSDDVSDQHLQIIVHDGSTNHVVDTINIPAGAGTNGTDAAVNGLAGAWLPLDAEGKKVLPLKQGCTLKAAMSGAVTSAKKVTVAAIVEDF